MINFAKIISFFMNKNIFCTILLAVLTAFCLTAKAQTYPSMQPYAVVVSPESEDSVVINGGDMEVPSFGSPANLTLYAEPSDTLGRSVTYRWRFEKQGGGSFYRDAPAPGVHEEELRETGSYQIVLIYTFVDDGGVVQEVIDEENSLRLQLKNSKLEFPNAFSPNGDGTNDYYGAKSSDPSCSCRGEKVCVHRGQSIVSFHATIYNRWGQKLYSWDDVTGSWDGKFNGTDVKDGVYYVHVEAVGADGITYDIKKDVNILRGYSQKDGIGGAQ